MTIALTGAGVQGSNWTPAKLLYDRDVKLWTPASASQCATGGSRGLAAASSQSFSVASNAAHNFGTGDILLGGHFYRTTTGNQVLAAKYQDATNYWKFELDASHKIHFIAVVGGVTKVEATSTTAVSTTTRWFHAAVAVDRSVAANTKIFLNGTDDTVATPTVSVDDIDNTGAFFVGQNGAATLYWNGRLSRLIIGKPSDASAVSAAFATATWNSGNGRNYADYSAAQLTAWGVTCHYALNETAVTANAVDQHAAVNLTQANSPGVADGPAAMVAIDSSGSGNTGRLIGFDEDQSWSSDVPNVPNCVGGYSLSFDGADDYVNVGTAFSTAFKAAGGYSVLARIKLANITAHHPICGERTSSPDSGWSFNFDGHVAGDPLRITHFNVADATSSAASGVSAGEWASVAATWSDSANTVLFYVNGVQNGTPRTITTMNTQALPAFLGSINVDGVDTGHFSGLMDDVRFYVGVLTPAQVAAWSAGDDTDPDWPSDANRVGHWKFNDGPQALTIVDGDPILAFESYEGSRYQFLNATAANRPSYDADPTGFNSLPAKEFDGTNDILIYTGNLTTGSSGLLAFVIRPASVTGVQCLFATADVGVADEYFGLFLNGTKLEVRQRKTGGTLNQITGDTVLAIGTTYVVVLTSSGTAWAMTVNGVAQSLTVTSGANNGNWFGDTANRDNVTLGALKTSSESSWFNGEIADGLLYDGIVPTANDINRVERYLNKRYQVY